jgi:hypothetical protein
MLHIQDIQDLVAEWRAVATMLREYGAEAQAHALERCATELEDGLRERAVETLSLQESAIESGYSADHLGRLVREGKIPNVGRKGAPRLRRADLPIRPKRRIAAVAERPPKGHNSNRQVVRSIIEGAG